MLVRLSLIDPRMPYVRRVFHSDVQCQTSRDIHFGGKGVCQNITRTISNIEMHTLHVFPNSGKEWGGESKILLEGGNFLLGGGNLGKSDFNQ